MNFFVPLFFKIIIKIIIKITSNKIPIKLYKPKLQVFPNTKYIIGNIKEINKQSPIDNPTDIDFLTTSSSLFQSNFG